MDNDEGPSVAAALELLVRRGASAREIADTVACTWRHIDESLTPIIGPQGIAALYKRSLLVTSRSHAWLAASTAESSGHLDATALTLALAQRESNDAAVAGSELLETFYKLVNGLIGTSLTHRLLNFMWHIPDEYARRESP